MARAVAAVLPLNWSYWVAERIGDIWYASSRHLRGNLAHNLTLLPTAGGTRAQRSRLARRIVRNFAGVVAEFLYLPRIDVKHLDRIVDLESFMKLKQEMAGRPAILLTAHLGNWELAAAAGAMLGIRLYVIALDHADPRIAAIFRSRREARGLTVMSVKSAAKDLALVLEAASVGIAGDRDFTGQGMPVDFFGVPTKVPSAYAGLAASRGIPVIPAFCVRGQDGKYHLESESAIVATADDRDGAADIVRRSIRIFEKHIEKYPEQWYRFDRIGE